MPASSPVFARYTMHQESELVTEPSRSYMTSSEKGPLLNRHNSIPSLSSRVSVGKTPKPQNFFRILVLSAFVNYLVFIAMHCLNCFINPEVASPSDEGMTMSAHHIMKEMHCCSLTRLILTLVALVFTACVQAGAVEY